LAYSYGDALEWVKLAEEALKILDYEVAARFFRYATIYFGLVNDASNQRKFAIKTGECYLQSAQELRREDGPLKAILLCIKAASYSQEGRSEELVRICDSVIRQKYTMITKDHFMRFHGEPHDLKGIGDYFLKNGDLERAIECYRTAAENASNGENPILSGGLYRDVGDCYQKSEDIERAAESYAKAAHMYLKGREYFEAAWHYCESGFMFIRLGRLEEASTMARKASSACSEGHIDVLLNDLSHICRLLSERALYEAEDRWKRIRIKFKRSYINLVDSCFEALRQDQGQGQL